MILRYNYFGNELDHEALIDTVPAEDKWIIDFNKFESIVGIFAITINKYMKYDEYTLIKDPEKLGNYQIDFYFTKEEYNQIKKYDPDFAQYMYHFLDRLAIDEEGNLYDIDDQEPASFDWYCYFLSTQKQKD